VCTVMHLCNCSHALHKQLHKLYFYQYTRAATAQEQEAVAVSEIRVRNWRGRVSTPFFWARRNTIALMSAPARSRSANPVSPDAPVEVLRQFRIVFNAVKTHFQQVEKQAGIGGAQAWALSIVSQSPGIGVGKLAKEMDVHQTTASNLAKALARTGLVAIHRGDRDRRTVHLQITAEGQQLLARVPAPFSGVLPEALARMDAQALRRLQSDLASLIALLQADSRAGKLPLAQL
jgi:DNA-binding MarR family transcriptional regulator